MMKQQKFGVEIELTGISRSKAATVIANLFGTSVQPLVGGYDARAINDQKGRTWKVLRDSSITARPFGDEYKVEVVTPILIYEDIEIVQEVLRQEQEGDHDGRIHRYISPVAGAGRRCQRNR